MPPQPNGSYRSRKKRKGDAVSSTVSTISTSRNDSEAQDRPAFPLAALFWPLKGTSSQWITLPCIFMIAGLFRWTTALWPYSGLKIPPMHGDFEAQRHWMEVTINLPTTHWYFHDLQWWGLDYPPLTAYHSWLLGTVGSLFNPSWFALYLSRGLDDLDLKVFMRASVIVSEYLVYIPAITVCVWHIAWHDWVESWNANIALTAILMQPATILIDHGHFQYNTVMLGFVAATIASMLADKPLRSCVFFVAALGFKQMALFYAPAVAAYLAGICLFPRIRFARLFGIATVTVLAFILLFVPLMVGTYYDVHRKVSLPSDLVLPPLLGALPIKISNTAWYYPYVLQITQSIHRIFPFSRGLFEDKVANVWCAIHASGLHKLHQYNQSSLSRAALALTVLAIFLPCLIIFFKPQKNLVPSALATTAWGFFLCSYQVHEKNVLLPLLPMTLLLAARGGEMPATRAWIGYANTMACWTMFPLLSRDGLRMPYLVLTALWAFLLGLPPVDFSAYTKSERDGGLYPATKVVHFGTYLVAIFWHALEMFVKPPVSKPDLWVVVNVCVGAAAFSLCYLWCLMDLANRGVLFGRSKTTPRVKTTAATGRKTQ